jgi:hypothetical protein
VLPHLSARLDSLPHQQLPALVRAASEQLLRVANMEAQLMEQLFGATVAAPRLLQAHQHAAAAQQAPLAAAAAGGAAYGAGGGARAPAQPGASGAGALWPGAVCFMACMAGVHAPRAPPTIPPRLNVHMLAPLHTH